MSQNQQHTTPIPFDQLPDSAVLRLPEVMSLTGWKRTSIYARMKDGTLPQSVRLGPRAVGWKVGAIRSYLQSLGQ